MTQSGRGTGNRKRFLFFDNSKENGNNCNDFNDYGDGSYNDNGDNKATTVQTRLLRVDKKNV